jgi:hypothetical protein
MASKSGLFDKKERLPLALPSDPLILQWNVPLIFSSPHIAGGGVKGGRAGGGSEVRAGVAL